MSPPCLESQGCQFDTTFLLSPVLLFYLVLLLFLSDLCLLLAASPDFFFPKTSIFRIFMWVLFFGGILERLGDEYFSLRYVQHILPHGTGIIMYAFIYYFKLRLFLSILFYIFI